MKPISNIWIVKMKRLTKVITLLPTETIQKIYLSVVTVKVKKTVVTLVKLMIQSVTQVTWIQYLILKINMFSILNTHLPLEKTSIPSFMSPWLNIHYFQHFFVQRNDHPIMRGKGNFISQI